MSGGGERLPVVIRAVGGRDVPGLLRMGAGGVRLDLPETQLRGYSPLKGLAAGRWNPLGRGRVRTYVACVTGRPVAFVQARERSPRQRHKWDILHLGASSRPLAGPPTAAALGRRADLWTPLLEYTTAAGARRGVQRLYAKLPAHLEAAEAFRAAGYVRYGEETIYLLHGRRRHPSPSSAAVALPRPQAPNDTWAVHQLYTLTAPKPVQYAEAHTSHTWELPRRWPALSPGAPREWGFVVERGHETAIYCRVGRQGGRARLDVVFEPAARDLLAPLIEAILGWLAPGPGERIYCAVREFQEELAAALAPHGFEPIGTQELLVRYTTASVRSAAPLRLLRPARERRLVGVPAHGSLRRQRGDTATPPPTGTTGAAGGG